MIKKKNNRYRKSQQQILWEVKKYFRPFFFFKRVNIVFWKKTGLKVDFYVIITITSSCLLIKFYPHLFMTCFFCCYFWTSRELRLNIHYLSVPRTHIYPCQTSQLDRIPWEKISLIFSQANPHYSTFYKRWYFWNFYISRR